MTDALQFAILAFTSLLAIVNPIGAVPIYVAMTTAYQRGQRAATLRRGIVTAFAVMTVFALLGNLILRFFGITTPAFQIAGGIIFFGIGWDMLQARRSRVKTTEEEEVAGAEKNDVGIIPLGIPGLAGPGAITTVVALQSQARSIGDRIGIYVSIVLVCLISWLLLAGAPAVTRRMGPTGMNVFTRLMGLLVMVVGAQFIINGVSVVARSILAPAV
jgi:multiple antibiotic resistance protein